MDWLDLTLAAIAIIAVVVIVLPNHQRQSPDCGSVKRENMAVEAMCVVACQALDPVAS